MRATAFSRTAVILMLIGAAADSGCIAGEPPVASPRVPLAHLFTHVGDFPIGPAAGRMDYQSLDAAARRLYIAKMGAGQLLVFDVEQNRLIATLDGFPNVTGVLVVPDLHKVYASVPSAGLLASLAVALGMMGLSSGSGTVGVVDTRTLHETVRLPGGVFPDGIAYDPKDHRIFVSDELGSAVLAIDAGADRLVARIKVGGGVGNVRYDSITEKVYAPIQSRNEFVVIAPASLQIVARRALPGCKHPHGLAIAPAKAVGYIACDGNDLLLAVDLPTGKLLDRGTAAHDPDVLALDPLLQRLYVASESGSLSTFDISRAPEPHPLGDVFIGADAHSVAVDPASHRLYFPLANVNGKSILRVLAPNLGQMRDGRR